MLGAYVSLKINACKTIANILELVLKFIKYLWTNVLNLTNCDTFLKRKSSSKFSRMEQVARVLRTACGPARNMTENECLSFGCCWDPTHDELEPKHCYTQSGNEYFVKMY